jgi:pyridinium-3,5-biscarboxylic acid mononucleotide sulfurtransferase
VDRLDALRDAISEAGSLVVAFSGGVDSALVADVASEVLGDRALIATAVSPSLSSKERDEAARLATDRGWNHIEVSTDELSKEGYRRNAGDRCYFCKETLFEALAPIAAERSARIAVGTNLDDLGDHRPGLKAAEEMAVLTPLVTAGMTKADVREAARTRGLQVAEKPATPCLASRIAYGVEVTAERLSRVAEAESFLREKELPDLRVRDHGDLARIEVPTAYIPQIAQAAEEIEAHLKGLGYLFVTLDLGGLRSGGLNALLTRIERVRP